jgi:hypothetical protein
LTPAATNSTPVSGKPVKDIGLAEQEAGPAGVVEDKKRDINRC